MIYVCCFAIVLAWLWVSFVGILDNRALPTRAQLSIIKPTLSLPPTISIADFMIKERGAQAMRQISNKVR